jgi:hypothetical protein
MASVPEKQKLFDILKKLKPTRYIFDIKQYRLRRSINQNNYYHACIVEPLALFLGYTKDEMHEVLKLKFNPKYLTNRQTGEQMVIGGSTTLLDTAEMEHYQDQIRIWALTELDFLIKLPNEY